MRLQLATEFAGLVFTLEDMVEASRGDALDLLAREGMADVVVLVPDCPSLKMWRTGCCFICAIYHVISLIKDDLPSWRYACLVHLEDTQSPTRGPTSGIHFLRRNFSRFFKGF